MIIKSMSRGDTSFGQLVRYIADGTEDRAFNLHRNLYAVSNAGIAAAFESNGQLLKARKSGVTMYHEIISITRAQGVPLAEQKQALYEIATAYAAERAPLCLMFGALHEDKENNLHYHLMISANRKDDKKRHRMARNDFVDLQRRLETRVLQDYPQLQQAVAINKKAERKKAQTTQELERRTGTLPERDQLATGLRSLFEMAGSEAQFRDLLSQAGFSVYVRGKHVGFKHDASGKKYRLQTLGLTGEFIAMSNRIEAARRQQHGRSQRIQLSWDPKTTTHHVQHPTKDTKPMPQITWRALLGPMGKIAKPPKLTHGADKPAPAHEDVPRSPLGVMRDAAYSVVKTVGDGVLDVIGGPSDPVIKRRAEIAEQRRQEMAALRESRQKQQSLFHTKTDRMSQRR